MQDWGKRELMAKDQGRVLYRLASGEQSRKWAAGHLVASWKAWTMMICEIWLWVGGDG